MLTPAQSDRLLADMRGHNGYLGRAAFLVDGSATRTMQLERMVRQVGAAGRRSFRSVPEMRAWLAEVATPGELAAIDLALA